MNRFDIYTADLNPPFKNEPGKVRPVVIVQSDLMNDVAHHTSIICPITSQVKADSEVLRIDLHKDQLKKPSQIIVDQMRAIDNSRLKKKLGKLTPTQSRKLTENLRIVLDL